MTLSTQNCENISAEGATVANVGAAALQAGNTAAIQTLTAQINELSAALEQIKSIPGYESDETCMGQLAQLEAQAMPRFGHLSPRKTQTWNPCNL